MHQHRQKLQQYYLQCVYVHVASHIKLISYRSAHLNHNIIFYILFVKEVAGYTSVGLPHELICKVHTEQL